MEVVLEAYKDDIYTITLNRPEKKNAMDYDLLYGINVALKNAESQKAPFVVIRGSGKAFCSGGDIVAFKEAKDAGALVDAEASVLHESIRLIRNINAIVIAVIEGVAVGAGIGLALACDLSIATKNTVMNMGYRRIGLTPDGGGSIFLSRLVGAKRFNELYLFSRNITMADAKDLGLVNIVCEEEELETKLAETIKGLKALPLETIGRFKDLVNHSLFHGLDTHLDKERLYVSQLAAQELFKQRLEEFFRKR
ncbi:MAG: 4-chlorobenzoyl coenzyme A dehalogenase-2 [Syntrophorhabdus sp. PtaU1.Bin058]|nr:MAG: 4-chlorobenzoyl coenzyme A dehalogenase-2 [Syntrophorhabdus sp. PtaU1.Bin058]